MMKSFLSSFVTDDSAQDWSRTAFARYQSDSRQCAKIRSLSTFGTYVVHFAALVATGGTRFGKTVKSTMKNPKSLEKEARAAHT